MNTLLEMPCCLFIGKSHKFSFLWRQLAWVEPGQVRKVTPGLPLIIRGKVDELRLPEKKNTSLFQDFSRWMFLPVLRKAINATWPHWKPFCLVKDDILDLWSEYHVLLTSPAHCKIYIEKIELLYLADLPPSRTCFSWSCFSVALEVGTRLTGTFSVLKTCSSLMSIALGVESLCLDLVWRGSPQNLLSDLRIYCLTSEFSVRPQSLLSDLRVYCPTSEFSV